MNRENIMRKLNAVPSFSALALVLLCGCPATVPPAPETAGTTEAAAMPQAEIQTSTQPPATTPMPAGSTSNCLAPPNLGPTAYTTPKDFALTRQADANCFAWQEFISLNWVASSQMRGQPDTTVTPAQFGAPNDLRATVWETYKESDEVFLANAQDPGPWNAWPKGSSASVKVLGGMKSEFAPEPVLDLSEIGQASPGHPWLTAQSGILTLYERRMNEDEYNYIWKNKLYDANVQWQFVVTPVAATTQTALQPIGISLPDGTANSAAYGPLGSIETKAAWLELPDSADWPRYKTSKAIVTYPDKTAPNGQRTKNVIVGLVGLHIIHKTALGQQFIWATFEHRDNCPDRAQVAANKLAPKYTYYNPSCNPATDPYKCVANANPATANGGGPGNNDYAWPIQVVRETPAPTRSNNDIVGINQYVWAQIAAQNPNSVYLNYELVNTLWSNQNTTVLPGARTPLVAAQLSPGLNQEPVSNTTLETYVQNLTCLTCHASAAIAPLTQQPTTKIYDPATAGTASTATHPYAADYSFLLNNAQQPLANQGNQ
jgi:hypothetical protein